MNPSLAGFPTPVLLIAWRRPHTTQQVIEAIRLAAPRRMYVACDGANPDRPGEEAKVAATRQVIEQQINWPCHIERLYSDTNQGCCLGPSRAISWFFEHVEEGIILEDDCVPHQDFFPYCTGLLERYRQDTRVWCIGGTNHQNGHWRGCGSYFFGRIPLIWGWASWRRCWQHYDADLRGWPTLRDSGLLESVFEDPLERNYWSGICQRLVARGDDPCTVWDYQWVFTCLTNGGLTVLPNRNLVSNIGFGSDATHTTGKAEPTPAESLGELRHPRFLLRHAEADRYSFDHLFGGAAMRRTRQFLPRVKVRLSHFWHHLRGALR